MFAEREELVVRAVERYLLRDVHARIVKREICFGYVRAGEHDLESVLRHARPPVGRFDFRNLLVRGGRA